MQVSVVIRCFNEAAHIGRLLTGITQQRDYDADIVVVDSGSTDATLDIAQRFPVTIERIDPRDFSFGRSLNLGFAAARAQIVVAASAHVYPERVDWLANLLKPFGDSRVALTYGRQIGAPTSAFSEQMIFRQWFPPRSELNQMHPFCNNANAAVRRSVWQNIRYDELLTGLEDLDWAKRAMAIGHRVSYVAEASVVHVHDQTWSQIMDRYRREAIAHRQIYNEQRMSRLEATSLGFVNAFRDLVAAQREGGLTHRAKEVAAFRSAQFLGTYRGFSQEGAIPAKLKRRFYYPVTLRPAVNSLERDPVAGKPIEYKADTNDGHGIAVKR